MQATESRANCCPHRIRNQFLFLENLNKTVMGQGRLLLNLHVRFVNCKSMSFMVCAVSLVFGMCPFDLACRTCGDVYGYHVRHRPLHNPQAGLNSTWAQIPRPRPRLDPLWALIASSFKRKDMNF